MIGVEDNACPISLGQGVDVLGSCYGPDGRRIVGTKPNAFSCVEPSAPVRELDDYWAVHGSCCFERCIHRIASDTVHCGKRPRLQFRFVEYVGHQGSDKYAWLYRTRGIVGHIGKQ